MTNKLITTFFFLCCTLQVLFLSAQSSSYLPESFIVTYDTEVTDADIEEVHAYYGITVFEEITLHGITREAWTIEFPITITTVGIGSEELLDDPIIIENIEDLWEFMAINPDNNTNNSGVIIINDYDLDYVLQIGSTPNTSTNYVLNPIPDCTDDLYRIAGEPEDNLSQAIKIIILDQIITDQSYFGSSLPPVGFMPINDNLGGEHGNKVASIIKHTLDVAGMTNYRFATLGVFDQNGYATYNTLLKGFAHLDQSGIRNAIINMSASVVIEAGNENFPLNMWEDIDAFLKAKNLLLISSASNDGGIMPDNGTDVVVYPSAAEMSNELTVTGLANCYETMALFSLGNNSHFEIGAQAEDILVWNGANYLLENGNSYATALVSAAAAQVSSELGHFNASMIKNILLSNSDNDPDLQNSIEAGRVLNTTAAIDAVRNYGLQASTDQGAHEAIEAKMPRTVSNTRVSPNPFTDHLNISLGSLSRPVTASLHLFNLNGQLIMQKEVEQVKTIEWNIPTELISGTYFLRIETPGQVISQRVLKL